MPYPKYFIILLITFIASAHIFFSKLPNGNLKVSFLDIGQGDSILIQTPYLQNILVDGGPGQKVLNELGDILPPVMTKIDLIILSHPHQDHMDGLIKVLDRHEVGAVLFSGVNYKSPFYTEFLKNINLKKIPTFIANSNNDLKIAENIYIDIIYPNKSFVAKNIDNVNNSSVVAKLIYGDKKIMFTGDCEKECEMDILKSDFDLSADILKVGHHGSNTSTTAEFLNSINPKKAIIQCGKDNKFGHPKQETLDKLEKLNIEIKRNDLEGRIEINL